MESKMNDFFKNNKAKLNQKKYRSRGENWTQQEKDLFFETMRQSASIIENKLTDTNTNKRKNLEWVKIQNKLKDLTGKPRDVAQLKGFWRRGKVAAKKAVSQYRRASQATDGGERAPSPSPEDLKIMALCPSIVEENLNDSDAILTQSSSKKTDNKHYKAVLKCCVDLVKVHGRPVEMFDDQAFRDILEMVPHLSEKHRKKLTTENIKTIIENYDKTGDDDGPDLDDTDMDKDMDASNDQFPVKGENIVQESLECMCGAPAQAEDSGVVRHQPACPTAVSQPYWNFFEVSLDVAKCTICGNVISWSDITMLKEHLMEVHPAVKIVDDDSADSSSVGSAEDLHEVYLEDEVFERHRVKGQDPISPPRKRMRTLIPDPPPKVVDRHGVEISLERFESLERFGLYVASLMKLIPKDKCRQFQVQIVERLIQEQAAAA